MAGSVPLVWEVAGPVLAVLAAASEALTVTEVCERLPEGVPWEAARYSAHAERMGRQEAVGGHLAALVFAGLARSETRSPWPAVGGRVVWSITEQGRAEVSARG